MSFYNADGWEFEIWESESAGLCAKIRTPAGREGCCSFVGLDYRLSELRTRAHIGLTGKIRLSDRLVDRLICAFHDYADEQPAGFNLVHI